MVDFAALAVARNALGNANVLACMRMIREKETNQTLNAYRLINGGKLFDDFSRHPYAGLSTKVGGRAAGVAQFIPSTWAEQQARFGLPDFSSESQDIAFVGCMMKRHALDDVIAGNIPEAIAKLRLEWTSLPGASESRSSWTIDKALAVYAAWGGKIATQPAAPIVEAGRPAAQPQEDDMPALMDAATPVAAAINPIAGLVMGLASKLIDAFSPLAQEKIRKEIGRHTDNPEVAASVAQSVVSAALAVTKMAPGQEIEAVAAAKGDPAIAQKVEIDTLTRLEQMAPALDRLAAIDEKLWAAGIAGKDAAQARGAKDKTDIGPMLAIAGIALVTVTMVALFVVLGVQLWQSDDHKPDVTLIALLGPLLGVVYKVFSELYAYRFDGTPKSNAADAIQAAIPPRP